MKTTDRYIALTLGMLLASPLWAGTVAAADESTDHERHREYFDRLDRNDNGYVSHREIRYARADTDNDGVFSDTERQVVQERRDLLDRNDDGRVGKRERRMRHADSNRDGYLNRREARRASGHRQQTRGHQTRHR
ncbi:MAG: EF-hand domain-containing protein [Gammaproteobacteria bacterium]|nr:MAG: EF-hand domain-containing protein [Gammaproteobacteria bacterium]